MGKVFACTAALSENIFLCSRAPAPGKRNGTRTAKDAVQGPTFSRGSFRNIFSDRAAVQTKTDFVTVQCAWLVWYAELLPDFRASGINRLH